MDVASVAVAGIVQGATEWLPISSSAQGMFALINFFGFDPKSAFSVIMYLHLGTLLAVTFRMRSDVFAMARSLPRFREDPLVRFILVSTFFTGVVGLPVYFLLVDGFSELQGGMVTAAIGVLLIATGVLLFFSRKSSGEKKASEVGVLDAVFAGAIQGVSILPGISRSGATTATFLLRGFRQEEALRLSFLMSIPAAAGAVALEVLKEGVGVFEPPMVVGVFLAFVCGYLTIDALLKVAAKVRFDFFCVALGLVAVLFFAVTQAF